MAEMIKTTQSICKKCIYSSQTSVTSVTVLCNYFLDTKNRRGCPPGMCDKYTPGRRKHGMSYGKCVAMKGL